MGWTKRGKDGLSKKTKRLADGSISTSTSWYAYVCVGGRELRKSTRTSDRRQARTVAAAWIAEQLAAGPAPRDRRRGLTVEGLQALDVRRAERRRVSPDQLLAIDYQWRAIVAALGDVEVASLTYPQLERYVDARLLTVRAQTVRREVQAIRRGLRLARQAGHDAPDLPAVELADDDPDQAQAGEAHPLPIMGRWLDALRHPTDPLAQQRRTILPWAQAVWVLYSGMRIQEARRMTIEWIAVEEGELVLRAPAQHRKTRDDHGQALHPCALDALRAAMAHHGGEHTGPLWPGNHRRAWATAAAQIGYPRVITARDLRHTFCSVHTTAGDLVATMDAMGHRSLQTTSRYAHSDLGRCRSALDALPDLLGGPDPQDLTPAGVAAGGAPGKPRRTCEMEVGVAGFEPATSCSRSTGVRPVLQLLTGHHASRAITDGRSDAPRSTALPDPRPDPRLTQAEDIALATALRDLLVAGRGAEVRHALTTAGLLPAQEQTA